MAERFSISEDPRGDSFFAHQVYRANADQDFGRLIYVGILYEEGQHVPKDTARAMQYYKMAADLNNDPDGCYLYATLLFDPYTKHHLHRAAAYLKKGVEQGHPGCMNKLGMLYIYFHYGLWESRKTGMQLWLRAARLGDAQTQSQLGLALLKGEDLPYDLKKGCFWCVCALLNQGSSRGLKKEMRDRLETLVRAQPQQMRLVQGLVQSIPNDYPQYLVKKEGRRFQ